MPGQDLVVRGIEPDLPFVFMMRTQLTRSMRLTSLVALVLGLIMLTSPFAWAEPGFSNGVSVPIPAGVNPSYFGYQSIACASAGNCTAIGMTEDEPFVVAQSSGAWGTPHQLAGFMTGGYDVNGPMRIACPSAGACVAVGGEQSGGDFGPGTSPIVEFPYLVTESGGTWGKIAFVAPPADANTATPSAAFTSLWCSSPANCIAVGPYLTSTGTTRAMESVETNGVWDGTTALPGSEVSGFLPTVYFSCSSMGNCMALSDSTTWTETAGVWGAPSAFAQTSSPGVTFQPLSLGCTTSGTCIVVGALNISGDVNWFAASDVETNGSWGTATALPMPKLSAVETRSTLSSISCQVSSCVAVGTGGHFGVIYSYFDPISATWSNGTWSSIGIDQVGPRGYDDSSFEDVSCPPTAPCEAVGQRATWTLPGYAGNISSFDTEIQPAEPVAAPGPPATVVAYAYVQGIELTWTPPTEDGGAPITSYTATLSPGGATCINTVGFCSFDGLTNGRQYVVSVRDTNGTAISTQRTLSNHVFVGAVPSTPGTPRAVRASNGEFAWRGSTSPQGEVVLRYEITAKGDGRTYHCVSTATHCIVRALPNGGPYSVTVSAFDVTGWSSPSATLFYGPTSTS
jgi:hypothetical protein